MVYAGTIAANQIGAGTLAAGVVYSGAIAANQIGAGTLAAGVVYAGEINANKITSGTLTGASIAIFGSSYNALLVTKGSDVVGYAKLAGYNIDARSLADPTKPAVRGQGVGDVGISGVGNSSDGNSHGVRGVRGAMSGLIGCSLGYDFYADGVGTGNYGPFTGAHDCLIAIDDHVDFGDIMVDTRCIARNGWSNVIFVATRSDHARQKNVIGVYVHTSGLLEQQYTPNAINNNTTTINAEGDEVLAIGSVYQEVKFSHNLSIINALGEGQVNVCGEGGDIAQGDYITTSSMPGKGMRQDDDLVHNYTVAKAREAVTFSSPNEVKQVACIYVCG